MAKSKRMLAVGWGAVIFSSVNPIPALLGRPEDGGIDPNARALSVEIDPVIQINPHFIPAKGFHFPIF